MRVGAPLVLACACSPRALAPVPDAGTGAGAIAAVDRMTSGMAPAAVSQTGDASAPATPADATPVSTPATPTTGPTACAPVEAAVAPVAPAPPERRVPTAVPFSCLPLPPAFIFAPPDARVIGRFSRCASFDVGEAKRLSISADGRLAALVPADGIVRVVELATRQVVAVLAPPRATITYAAFEPAGRAILTLAAGEREVTLWPAAGGPPTWTVRLPGRRYDFNRFGGGVAFAPDGGSAVVSPGDGVFLLDAATGAIRATRPPRGALSALMDLAYGWGGRRIVVAEAATIAHCQHGPNGGAVTVLDAATLAEVATLEELGSYANPGGWRGIPAFLAGAGAGAGASATDDRVLTVARVEDQPGIKAFKLSDGAPLPRPALETLPVAFMPDGARALVRANGGLAVVALDGGGAGPTLADAGTGPVAVLPDGKVLVGGRGAGLLRLWDVAGGAVAVCGARDDGASQGPSASLSSDGRLLAFGRDRWLRLVRTSDGTALSTVSVDDPSQLATVALAPDGRFAVAAPRIGPGAGATLVFRLSDGARVAELAPDAWSWADHAFSPREDALYATGYRQNDYRLDVVRLDDPGTGRFTSLPKYTTLLGFSAGCPVFYEQSRGAWRGCGACADAPVGGPGAPGKADGVSSAVLSADGGVVAVRRADDAAGVTIWPMRAGAPALRTFAARVDEWKPRVFPIAVTPGATRVITGATAVGPCYAGPSFEAHVHDGATGALIDALPPGVVSVDRDARTLAYGAQLWCER